MRGETFSRVMTNPFTTPIARDSSTTASTAGTIMAELPRMVAEAATAATLITVPTDRSMEPQRITTVWPSATVPSATMRCSRPTRPPIPSCSGA